MIWLERLSGRCIFLFGVVSSVTVCVDVNIYVWTGPISSKGLSRELSVRAAKLLWKRGVECKRYPDVKNGIRGDTQPAFLFTFLYNLLHCNASV